VAALKVTTVDTVLSALGTTLFWISLVQWALFAPTYTWCIDILFRRGSTPALRLIGGFMVLLLVALVALALPLMLLGLFPVPIRTQRAPYVMGLFCGGTSLCR
jgi:hypothetical protein